VSDIYSSYILNKRATHYGTTSKESFKVGFKREVTDSWLPRFNPSTVAFEGQSGVTIESLQFLEIISSQGNDLGDKAKKATSDAISSLMKHTSAMSFEDTSENQIFFIAPRNAKDP